MTIVKHKQALKRQTVLTAGAAFPFIPMQVNENSLKTIMSGTKTRLPRQPKTVTNAKSDTVTVLRTPLGGPRTRPQATPGGRLRANAGAP
jgi:hypothetical protein